MKKLAILLNKLTGMDSFVLSRKGKIRHAAGQTLLPDILVPLRQQIFRDIAEERQSLPEKECLHYRDSCRLNYLAVSGLTGSVLLGPFLTRIPDSTQIREIMRDNGLPLTSREPVRNYFRGLPILENRRISALTDTMRTLMGAKIRSGDPVRRIRSARPEVQPGDVLKEEEFPDFSIIEERYEVEAEMMDAVARGDRTAAKNITLRTKDLMNFPDRIEGDPLRSLKDLTITLNTLLRIAARQGRLHPRYLHSISEKYAILLEKGNTLKDIQELQIRMINEYCDRVRYNSTVNYSSLVSRCVHLILSRLQEEELSLDYLARELSVNPSYLSRLFHRETEKTLTRYIQEKRIEEAARLLVHTSSPVADIALQTGFPDSAYFSRVFSRIQGISPTGWRNRHQT